MKKQILSIVLMLSLLMSILPLYVTAAIDGNEFVQYAKDHCLGIPYVSGGRTTKGFDCCGLVWYVCNHFGIDVGTGNQNSQRNYGTAISYSKASYTEFIKNLQPGDLIFFDYENDGVSNHVGIYSGNGKIIQAHRPGVVSQEDNLNGTWLNGKKEWELTCSIRRVVQNATAVSQHELPSKPMLGALVSKVKGESPTIKWTESTNTTYYEVHVDNRTTGQEKFWSNWGTTERELKLPNFEPGEYSVYVMAINENLIGQGVYYTQSIVINFTIEEPLPSAPVATISTARLKAGEIPILWWTESTNTTYYEVHVDNQTTGQVRFWSNWGTTEKELKLPAFEPGQYSVYVVAINENLIGKGVYCTPSAPIIFLVEESSLPSNVWIKADKSQIAIGETITFTYGATNPGSYYGMGIDKQGVGRIQTLGVDSSGYSTSFQEPGEYSVYVTSNVPELQTGVDSNIITFTVYDPNVKEDTQTPGQVLVSPSPVPETEQHLHNLIYFQPEVAACEWGGIAEYWYCYLCDKYFKDESALYETSFDSLKTNALGHNYVDDICQNCGQSNVISTPTVHFSRIHSYSPNQFRDVAEEQWFTKSVSEAYEFGLMNGNSVDTFNPYGDVTIAETLTLAARIHRIYHTGTDSFSNYGSLWYQPYIDYIEQNDFVNVNDYHNIMNNKATREQFAEILSNCLPDNGLYPINYIADNAIPDIKIGDHYGNSIYKLYRAGILTGSDILGNFSPKSYITRAEVATIVSRIANSDNRVSFTLD